MLGWLWLAASCCNLPADYVAGAHQRSKGYNLLEQTGVVNNLFANNLAQTLVVEPSSYAANNLYGKLC